MDLALQGSLLDLTDEMTLRDVGAGLRRAELGNGAWVDVRPGWLAAGDDLFTSLLRDVPWHAERRQMYDSVVAVPRLTRFYGADERLPHPMLAIARDALSAHYATELREPFVTAGLCLYRDGHDSVAWHGDRVGRSSSHDTMVAILSLGSARVLALRPRDGVGALPSGVKSLRFPLAHGDPSSWVGPANVAATMPSPRPQSPSGPASRCSSG